MEYKGKLYGKIAGNYFDTGVTSDDYDALVAKTIKLDDVKILAAKEKAQQLVNAFIDLNYFDDKSILEDAKYSAEQTIDQMIMYVMEIEKTHLCGIVDSEIRFLEKVKQEINNIQEYQI